MRIEDLFFIRPGNSLSLNRLTQVSADRGVAFVSRSAQNNGVVAWVKELEHLKPFPAGLVTVSLRSRNHALATFVQTRPFYTAYHLFVLEPRNQMSTHELLWWSRCIEANRYRYNYGRQANRSLAGLRLPSEMPPWLNETDMPRIDSAPVSARKTSLPALTKWRWFALGELFGLHRGGGIIKREAAGGDTPLVSASARNNGVSARVAAPPVFPSGWITVCSNGSVGEAFVQPEGFVATADITVLEPQPKSSLAARLFMCTVIRHEKYRFNYGRKWPAGRISESRVRLPATRSGAPDYAVMERVVMSLPFSRFVSG